MSEKSNSTLPVILLVVGLVLGGGGGYFFANNSFQPQKEALEAQITVISTEIDAVTTQIGDLDEQVDDITNEVNALDTEKIEKTAEYNAVQSEFDTTQATLETTIERRNTLEALVTPMDGCYKVNLFGLSFDCPSDVTLEAASAIGGPVDASWSIFSATDSNEQYAIDVSWISVPYYEQILEVGLIGGIEAMADVYDISYGNLENITIAGFSGKYLVWSGSCEEYTNGIIAVFYCDSNSKLYILGYDTVEAIDMEACYVLFNSMRVS